MLIGAASLDIDGVNADLGVMGGVKPGTFRRHARDAERASASRLTNVPDVPESCAYGSLRAHRPDRSFDKTGRSPSTTTCASPLRSLPAPFCGGSKRTTAPPPSALASSREPTSTSSSRRAALARIARRPRSTTTRRQVEEFAPAAPVEKSEFATGDERRSPVVDLRTRARASHRVRRRRDRTSPVVDALGEIACPTLVVVGDGVCQAAET